MLFDDRIVFRASVILHFVGKQVLTPNFWWETRFSIYRIFPHLGLIVTYRRECLGR
jgi:hypothetical protein